MSRGYAHCFVATVFLQKSHERFSHVPLIGGERDTRKKILQGVETGTLHRLQAHLQQLLFAIPGESERVSLFFREIANPLTTNAEKCYAFLLKDTSEF
jgi:hypothetical protein